MFAAEVGDDVYGEDPSMNVLEGYTANLFEREAALFCPSGTMCNQIGIKLHTQQGTEVICDAQSHVYLYEGGGIMWHSGASVKLLNGDRGRLTAAQVEAAISSDDVHFPPSKLVVLENTQNRGGGACYDIKEIERIRKICDKQGLKLHLDGARLFNALVATGEKPARYGKLFDTISICLSKGLGAPVGSVLLGNAADIKTARRYRKVFGGGMRQAGFLAAAGLYALQNHVQRLAEDHARAKKIGSALKGLTWVQELMPVETNIVLFRMATPEAKTALLAHLKRHNILAGGFGPLWVRLVVHLDVNDSAIDEVVEALKVLKPLSH